MSRTLTALYGPPVGRDLPPDARYLTRVGDEDWAPRLATSASHAAHLAGRALTGVGCPPVVVEVERVATAERSRWRVQHTSEEVRVG